MNAKRIPTQVVVEVGLAVAMAAVLGLIRVFTMPQGGSVSLEMVPVLFMALRHGVGIGAFTGAVYGLVQLVMGAFVVHPAQFILDYPLAYAALGLAGLAARVPWRGIVLACAGRYVAHVLSGVIFFAMYAPEGVPVLQYSLVYNASYMIPETVIAVAALSILMAGRLPGRLRGRGAAQPGQE